MATFEEAMQVLIYEAEAVSTNMTIEDRRKVTKAGAKVFQEALGKEVRSRHYRNRKATKEDPHLADEIVVKNSNVDGVKDGTSVVGWERDTTKDTRTVGYIANIINNGSKIPQFTSRHRKYKHPGAVLINADHFIEDTRNNPVVQAAILAAESKAMKKIIERRNSG